MLAKQQSIRISMTNCTTVSHLQHCFTLQYLTFHILQKQHLRGLLEKIKNRKEHERLEVSKLSAGRKLEKLQREYSTELNIELGSEGRPVLRLGFLSSLGPPSCWPRYTLWVFVLRLLHTLPVWKAEGCFKVSFSHVLPLALSSSLLLFASRIIVHIFSLSVFIHHVPTHY